MSQGFSWHELPLKEVGQFATFRQLCQSFRQQNAVGLITRLEALQGCVVLNLLAPRNTAFWGVSSSVLLVSVYDHLQKVGLRGDAQTKKLFLQDLRKASVKLSDPAIHLFSNYRMYFPSRTSSLPGFSEDGVTVEQFRFISLACSETALPHLTAHLELQAQQFGDLAYFAIDDHINLNSGDYIGEEKEPYQYLFRRWTLAGYDEARRSAWLSALRFQLERALDRVDIGENLDVPVSPAHFIRPSLSFVLMDKHTGWYDEIGDSTCRTIISLRVRLVRELGWPAFYGDVCNALTSGFNGEPRRIDTYGQLEPYDVVTELEEYKWEMEQRYPCLLDNPFG